MSKRERLPFAMTPVEPVAGMNSFAGYFLVVALLHGVPDTLKATGVAIADACNRQAASLERREVLHSQAILALSERVERIRQTLRERP